MCLQLAWISIPTKIVRSALSLLAKLRMQTHQPLRQRLGIVAHRVNRGCANGDVAISDVEAVKSRERARGVVADGF